MMTRIDLALSTVLAPENISFEAGSSDFLSLLEQLRTVPSFDVDWGIQPESAGPFLSVWREREKYLTVFRRNNEGRSRSLLMKAAEASEDILYVATYSWSNIQTDRLSCEIYYPHPRYGVDTQHYIRLVDVVTRWKRPLHLAFGPVVYMRDHHPVDRGRLGIRWIGWVPFSLNSADVPEAELVQPLNGGSLVMTQSDFWQAWEAHPEYSREAIQRAQDVEIRLNLLGVLPTAADLASGNWGR
jgi:hypothetical protein